ncbi:MAG: hypothetical protein RIF32_23995 [Leptospirales bacterium]
MGSGWPILALSPGRAQLFDRDRVLEYTGSIGAPEREALLEQCDAAFFAPGSVRPAQREESGEGLYWDPPGRELREFLSFCRASAVNAGGLRCATREAFPLPLEALRLGGEWSTAFPIARMHARDASLGLAAVTPDAPGPPRKLVWFNPAGKPELPVARAEAEAVFEILEQSPGPARFIARGLSDHEWYELYDSHDVVFYYGHGQSVAGHPAILTRNGRAPFFAPLADEPESSESADRRCLVFAACLSGGAQVVFRNQSGAVVYPLCRLADRSSEYLPDFCRAFAQGASVPAALLAAARADAARGDLRRFLFRLQGVGRFC